MNYELYRVSAFDNNGNGGNPAGVVLKAETLTESKMLCIAKEVGFSETAFIMSSQVADFKVRFFTPVDEVDLCGHATIGTFNLLRDLGIVRCGEICQETKAGILKLDIQEKVIYMEQNNPSFSEKIDKNELIKCFDIDKDDIDESLPIQIVSTGLRDIILPVRNLDRLLNMKADNSLIAKLSEKYNAVGIHAFSLETVGNVSAHARNFAPAYGIDEESATGTANGALACYLFKHTNSFDDGIFEFEQGYSMGCPSKISVKLNIEKDKVNSVYVGGSARII